MPLSPLVVTYIEIFQEENGEEYIFGLAGCGTKCSCDQDAGNQGLKQGETSLKHLSNHPLSHLLFLIFQFGSCLIEVNGL